MARTDPIILPHIPKEGASKEELREYIVQLHKALEPLTTAFMYADLFEPTTTELIVTAESVNVTVGGDDVYIKVVG